MPMIVLGRFFETSVDFGSWTNQSYFVFLFIGYCILLMRKIITQIGTNFLLEKFWKTLPGLIIAPINRMYLLFGAVISHFILIMLPLVIFLILAYILFPISILTLMIIILMLFMVLAIFASLGLILGVFIINLENINRILNLIVGFVFWASCITYPFDLFPEEIQSIIRLNPIYYLIDFLRYTWIEDNILLTIISHPTHSFIFISMVLITPIIGLYFFNYIYKKLGIQGY
jgi:ABC-type polysaccharide/polyol phosphate export permease